MARKYHMVLHSPLGPREGLLTLREVRGAVTGTLCILFYELPVSGSREADGRLHLVHPIITALYKYPCQSTLQEAGATLSGELHMDLTNVPWGCSRYQPGVVMVWSGEELIETEDEHI